MSKSNKIIIVNGLHRTGTYINMINLQKLNLELYYDKLYDQGWEDSFKTNEN